MRGETEAGIFQVSPRLTRPLPRTVLTGGGGQHRSR